MKNVILLIIVLFFCSCASKKNIEPKEISEYTIQRITESFDAKKLNYIGLKKYCIGSIRLNTPSPKNCTNCRTENDIYVFWTKNGKSYVQKFDNCSEFNVVEIFDFQPSVFLKKNTLELQTEKVGPYKIDENTYSSVSHSCFRNYILNNGQIKYEKEFDIFDLTGENDNLNFKVNNDLRLVQLDKKLNEIIAELENENRFERDKKTCYNKVYN